MKKHINYRRAKAVLGFALLAGILFVVVNESPRTAVAAPVVNDQTNSKKKPEKVVNPKVTDIKRIGVSPSKWGGRGASFVVEKKSVKIEFDCAEGEIRQQLKTDRNGNLKVNGLYMRQPFGPTLVNNEPKFAPAVYKGRIMGKTMTFSVAWNDTDPPIAEYVVERGKAAQITKCR